MHSPSVRGSVLSTGICCMLLVRSGHSWQREPALALMYFQVSLCVETNSTVYASLVALSVSDAHTCPLL